ncbi:hypothetical protein K431DRAFT_315466 [Polychaeton citri CBS 116435]|uniref:Uncharacterized protein n=1 Tax=Polychaeton citri CBS 116435 TaxID=1314669 RepID=A0A9P4ULG6_9PEZI|nr:hypothetical protein K431DRAFT_315466 [Polychaeton citri CBS 116435]
MAAWSGLSRSTALWILIVLSSVTQIILTALVWDVSTAILSGTTLAGTALAASVLNLLVLINLLYSTAILLRLGPQRCGKFRLATDVLGLLIFLVSILLTIYILSWSWIQHNSHTGGLKDVHQVPKLVASLTFWAVNAALQFAMQAFWMLPWTRSRSLPSAERSSPYSSPARSTKRSISLHLAVLPPPPALFKRSPSSSGPVSPTFSLDSTPRSSIRYSMTQVVRPITSRTRLLLRQSSLSRDSRSIYSERPMSIDTAGHDDGFGSWDTSAVEDHCENGTAIHVLRRKLETIPQSRPVSPARALDGPFVERFLPENVPLPDSPMTPTVLRSDSFDSLPRFQSFAERRGSGNDELHIHPLFRTNNPSPTPPTMSPGTIITASPFAGQVVPRAHSSHGSRPGSPSPLAPVISRASSYRSLKQAMTASTEPEDVPPLPKPTPSLTGK